MSATTRQYAAGTGGVDLLGFAYMTASLTTAWTASRDAHTFTLMYVTSVNGAHGHRHSAASRAGKTMHFKFVVKLFRVGVSGFYRAPASYAAKVNFPLVGHEISGEATLN